MTLGLSCPGYMKWRKPCEQCYADTLFSHLSCPPGFLPGEADLLEDASITFEVLDMKVASGECDRYK